MNNVIDIKQLEATAAVAKNYVLDQAESTIDSITTALSGGATPTVTLHVDTSNHHSFAVQTVDIENGVRLRFGDPAGIEGDIDVTYTVE